MAEEKQTPLIMIDDEYGISVDPIDYSLRKVSVSEKTGKTRQDTCGYFSSIQGCLNDYMKQKIHDSLKSDGNMTLKEAENIIVFTLGQVTAAISKAFPEYEVTKK